MNLLTIYLKESLDMSSNIDKDITSVLKAVRDSLSEQMTPGVTSTSLEAPKPKRKATKVIFDKSTGTPFEVIFSERGFSVDGTRLSFEDLETAISKEFNIVLQNGKGVALDAVKMQKILKYKDLY